MRTKTLLLTAAALAAGFLSASAQVYSVNVVGYVNVPLPAGQFLFVANPLNDNTNTLNSTLGALANKSQAQFWNGSGFDLYQKGGGTWPVKSTPVGTGFFVKSVNVITNTFVGETIVGPGGTTTNLNAPLAAGVFYAVGSPLPYAGSLNDTNLNLDFGNKSQIQIWNGSGFNLYQKGGGTWPATTNLAVAQGFFLKSVTATNWIQKLPAN